MSKLNLTHNSSNNKHIRENNFDTSKQLIYLVHFMFIVLKYLLHMDTWGLLQSLDFETI